MGDLHRITFAGAIHGVPASHLLSTHPVKERTTRDLERAALCEIIGDLQCALHGLRPLLKPAGPDSAD
jgi:hypothetical protein